jgi:hypothetical protein
MLHPTLEQLQELSLQPVKSKVRNKQKKSYEEFSSTEF